MSLSRGDVVLALFPFTDASGAKKRPWEKKGAITDFGGRRGKIVDDQ